MIRSFRAYFLSRALREKLLLVAFVLIGAVWWLSAYGTRAGQFLRVQRATEANLKTQAEWIKNQVTIEETAQKTAAQLDPARTLNGNQLVTTVAQIARDAGLQNARTGGNPTTRRSDQFSIHEVDYTITGGDWTNLVKFYEELQKRSPYIAVERFILKSESNPALLTLGLRVVAFEIAR